MIRTAPLVFALVMALFSTASAQTPMTVKLRQSFIPSEQYIPEQVAIDKNMYEAQGLHVEMLRSTGGSMVTSLVAVGSDQFGIAGAADVLIARNKGLGIVAIGLNSPKDPTGLFSLASNPIGSIADIRGKRIGAIAGSTAFGLLQAFLKMHDLSDQDVKLTLIGAGELISSVMSQRVDAVAAFETTVVPAIRAAGANPVSLRFSDHGLRVPGNVYIANADFARDNPGVVAHFMAATIQGWQYVQKNGANEGLKLVVKAYPELASQQAFLAQRWEFREQNGYNPYSKDRPLVPDAFKFDPRTLQTLNSALVSAQLVKPGLDVQKAFSNRYVDAAERLMK